jgi:hypothetical protein
LSEKKGGMKITKHLTGEQLDNDCLPTPPMGIFFNTQTLDTLVSKGGGMFMKCKYDQLIPDSWAKLFLWTDVFALFR